VHLYTGKSTELGGDGGAFDNDNNGGGYGSFRDGKEFRLLSK
jgi:hypothetical protein